jgi:hypothetical protein
MAEQNQAVTRKVCPADDGKRVRGSVPRTRGTLPLTLLPICSPRLGKSPNVTSPVEQFRVISTPSAAILLLPGKSELLSFIHSFKSCQELFEQEELTGYLKNLIAVEKSVYEQVVYDSDTEARFADQLEKNTAIKVYAKLPGWFTVPTPLGSYNPDWAVLVEKDGSERLYFVVETKGGLFADEFRDQERAKIECGRAHFKALSVSEAPARYVVARSLDQLLD